MSGVSRRSIVFVIGSLREGGAEKQLLYLMRGLRERGWEVRLMLLHYEGMRLQPALDDGFEIFPVNLPRFRPRWNPLPWLRLPAVLWRCIRYVRRANPAIIHAWLFWAHLWSWLITWFVPVALITSRRQIGTDKAGSRLLVAIENLINRRATRVICNAKAVEAAALARERNLHGKTTVIRNAIDISAIDATPAADLRGEFPQLRHARLIGIVVANLLPYKGYDDLVEAWRILQPTHADVALLCVGSDGGIQAHLEQQINAAGLADRIVLAGRRPDAIALVKAADFALHVSHDEGFSNAIMEELACGKALIATPAGGALEILRNGENALVVPIGDPAAIAKAVGRLTDDERLRSRLCDNGRATIEVGFRESAMINSHIEVYGRQVGRSSG